MKIAVRVVGGFLALVLGVFVSTGQAATLPSGFDASVLADLKNELNGFGTDYAKQISNALLDTAGVEQDGNAYVKKVKLFGKETTIFFMYGQKRNAQQKSVSVVAVMIPMDLTTRALFGDSVPALGLKNPVVCYAKEDCTLFSADMPTKTQPSLKSIMPGSGVVANKGLNFLGTLTSSIEGFPSVLPNELFAGFATGKDDKGQKKYVINAAIIKPWSSPFGLQNTTMKGGMIRIRKEGEIKTTESWGTASVGSSKEYTLYFKQEGSLQQSLGFDAQSATLADFFSILDALGMPFETAKKNLPLTIVQLSNPNFQAKVDASALPDFTKMLFKATRTSAGVFTELIANAEGSLLKQKMASLILNASAEKKSVIGSAAVNAKLGPLDAASANFYLDANLTAVPKMGLKVKSGVFGDLDLAASGNGLKLAVPANCPVRPIGFTAQIADLTLTDFPITPDLKDCYSQEIAKVFNGTVEMASDVGETVAKGAADTAKGLADEAKKNYEKLHVERVSALTQALTNRAAATNAVNAASTAYNTATNAVNESVKRIGNLDKDISNLAKDINNLLKKAWAFVSGQVKSKKAEKSKKESERDRERVAKAAAEKRKQQASEALEKAKKGMDDAPGPNFDPAVASANEQLLGHLAQQEVQAQVAAYAETELTRKLKSQDERKKMLQAVKQEEFVAEQEEAIKASYPSLSTLIAKGQDGKMPMDGLLNEAKSALAVKVVSKDIEAKTEALLKQTVPTLPTMAFEVPVNVVYGEGSAARCLEAPPHYDSTYDTERHKLVPCSDAQGQRFKFRAGGDLVVEKGAEKGCMMFVKFPSDRGYRVGGMQVLMKDCKGDINWADYILYTTKFFFDPIEGNLITYFSNTKNPKGFAACITATNGVLNFTNECPPPKDALKWRLIPAGQTKDKQAASVMKAPGVKGVGAKPPVVSPATTNLDPLRLE